MIRLPSAASVGRHRDPLARSSDACYQQLVGGRVDGSGVCFGSEEVKWKLLFRVRLDICAGEIRCPSGVCGARGQRGAGDGETPCWGGRVQEPRRSSATLCPTARAQIAPPCSRALTDHFLFRTSH